MIVSLIGDLLVTYLQRQSRPKRSTNAKEILESTHMHQRFVDGGVGRCGRVRMDECSQASAFYESAGR